MPQIKSGFTLKSKSPNFERDSFDTLYEMKYVNKEHIDEGHLSYCRETRKYYTFSTDNRYDEITGYWKELVTGNTDLENRLIQLEKMVKDLYELINQSPSNPTPSDSISCELLTPNGTKDIVVEYEEKEKILQLSINVFNKNISLDRDNIDELSITTIDGSIGSYDKYSSKVDFTIPAKSNGNHSATLKVSANDQTCEAKCNVYQRVPIFLGWSQSSTANVGMLSEGSLMTKKVSTTSKGTYNYGEVGKGFYFWTFVPANGVSHYSKIDANGFEMVMQDAGTLTYKGEQYICRRKPEASVLSSNNWKIILS